MSADVISAIATVLTALIIGVSAVIAMIQLRHMRAGNELEAVLSLERDFRNDELQVALRYVQADLPQKLHDRAYRGELERRGFIDHRAHPEIIVCNWCNTMGTLLRHRLVGEATFMALFARLIAYYWDALEPVVAIMQRARGSTQYDDFEYLALRAKHWLSQSDSSEFPNDVVRVPLKDSWRADDLAAP